MPTALIVEDEPDANKLLSLLVQLRGYRTESAFTGGEAMEKVGQARPDIIFLDLMLPDANGYDICKALKSHRQTNPIPVVVVTARVAAESRAQSYRVGATEHVPKPYTPDQIFAAMASADSWRHALDQNGSAGAIPLRAHDEVVPFVQVSRLGSLLLARTSWEEDEVRQIVAALIELEQAAVDWGRRNAVDLVATLGYQIHPDRVVLTIRDESGWFSLGSPPRERLDSLISRGRFDGISDLDGDEVTLTRHSSPPDA